MKNISSYLDSHLSENFTIHEVGMSLIPEYHAKIRARLESLESRSPAISSTHIKFSKKGSEIKGELSIFGAGKKFHSENHGQDPWEIYKSLEREIDKQLIRWKKTRSLYDYHDAPFYNGEGQLKGGYAV